jgi:hypothetical protein
MARLVLLIGFALFLAFDSSAQSRTLTGTLVDGTARRPLVGATVQLRSLSDSSLLRTLTDSTGTFTFTNLRRDSFLLNISYVGFNPISRRVSVDTSDVTIDIAAATSASSGLETVVIRTAVSPVTQRGDTLQVNASQFKVNPDASSEDLVRKVPGITIENGQVKAQGENVQRVTIDGRELFGDDATAALRNLPAEVVDKIQIFDRLSDQAQFTGFDDGSATKSINIVTKANMRNGQFGRIFGGYGTDERYQAGGNTTFLKGDRRISLVGNFNNINQQNFSQQDLLGVTSNAQRGGGGGGPRGGGGNPRGGSGNRGPSGAGGNQGGGNFGGFGNNGNFLVGQQAGINRTNAFGINYTDLFGKKKNLTLTGSYFINDTRNTTNEIATNQYFAGTIAQSFDSTRSMADNLNHRVNARIEWRIDSSNQLIITPNMSWQSNQRESSTGRLSVFQPGRAQVRNFNRNITNSDRTGNNLNNTILFRHAFPKRGRTISINVNTSFNSREGESYVSTFQRLTDSIGNFSDSTSNRLSEQDNDGRQVSTNLVYTEPLGTNSQLQHYNPSWSRSNSEQLVYGQSGNSEYTTFLDSLSNTFRNRTDAQNAGISYRYGNRDKQISFGANYQQTTLKSDQSFPRKLNVNKTFSNILPNAMIRWGFSPRSNLRLMYRTNVNQPSVTQLQNVIDITNAPVFTSGNPDLDQQFSHTFSTRYTFTNTQKGLLFVANVFWQRANDYIANATFTPVSDSAVGNGVILRPGDLLTKPVNLDGYQSLRTFLTFAVPVKLIKSNLNLNGGVTFSKLPGLINYVQNETKNTTYTAGLVVASNVSQYVDFTVSYTANFNDVSNALQPTLNNNYFQHVAGVSLNLLNKKGWFLQNDVNNQYYSGLSAGFNQSYTLWNASIGKKFLKDQRGELKLGVFDLLGQNQSIQRNVTETYIEDVQNQVLQRYFMLTFTYSLRNFGVAASRGGGFGNSGSGNRGGNR